MAWEISSADRGPWDPSSRSNTPSSQAVNRVYNRGVNSRLFSHSGWLRNVEQTTLKMFVLMAFMFIGYLFQKSKCRLIVNIQFPKVNDQVIANNDKHMASIPLPKSNH